MGVSFMFPSGSNFGRRRQGWWHGFLEAQNIENGQYPRRIEDGEADKPRQLVVARAFPHGDQLPYPLPDCQEDNHDDKHDKQRTFHIRLLVDGFGCSDHLMK
jgi:arylsulfatase A-like enzyme